MSHRLDDTIAAVATADGGAARGIVRVSGPAAIDCLAKIFEPDTRANLDDIRAAVVSGHLMTPALSRRVPCEVYLWRGRRSYTREPVVEIHTLGSPPVLEAILAAVCDQGARLARPGEFTLRAFLAGRLDLAQAEAVLGVIDAVDRPQLDQALAQMAGGLLAPLAAARNRLLDLLAELEAGLDFADEDLTFLDRRALAAALSESSAMVSRVATSLDHRAAGESPPRVALIGPPNAGKSTLFNALARREEAIVSHVRGTTRDLVTAMVDLEGVRCELVDTAGIESEAAAGSLDQAAQAAMRQATADASVLLVCQEVASESALANELGFDHLAKPALHIFTKADLATCEATDRDAIVVSAMRGEGLDNLSRQLRARLVDLVPRSELLATTAARCGQALSGATDALARAADMMEQNNAGRDELLAAELRMAIDFVGEITGAVYTDDILDRVFSKFCIGK